MPNNWITWNTWEWSELYALVFILTTWGMFGADKNQNKRNDLFYRVLEVFLEWKKKSNNTIQYIIFTDYIEMYNQGSLLWKINTSDLKKDLNKFFLDLSSKNDWRAYALESWSKLLELLNANWIKASSRKKKDIDLIILDSLTKLPSPTLWFSIKSQLWSPSTLLNASKPTNFIYEVLDSNWGIPEDLPLLHEKNVKDNICLLLEQDFKIEFRKIQSNIFETNLRLIDSSLPEYISNILLLYYARKGTKLVDLTEITFLNNPQAKFKIKEFIAIMAFWMMPNTAWDWILTTLGGMLLVKKDWEVLCYYLYNLKDFQDYLYENVKFETPSTSRYKIGKIFEEWWRYFIRLNLDIRFLK